MGMRALSHIRQAYQARRELRDYFVGLLESRRRQPSDDVLSVLVRAEDQGDRLSREDLLATIELLLVAGNETTTNLIGNGVLALLRHREQWDTLVADPSLVTKAVEELLRYDSPVQVITRFATTDLEIGGRAIRAGERLVLLLGSANRDPARYPAPDRLDITRNGPPPLSFSHGPHYCLGAPLARMEAAVVLGALVRRFPRMRLAPGGVDWADNVILRGLRRLLVVLDGP